MTKLTLICPNQDSGIYIKQSIKTFLSQDYNSFNIYIMDSDSKDNSKEIINSFNSNIIKIFDLDRNVDGPNAVLLGIQNTTSDYIAFMTSTDGYVDNQWFGNAIKLLDSDDNLSYVYSNSLNRDLNENISKVNQPFYSKFEIPSHEYFLPFYMATRYHINELNCIWSTPVIKSLINHEYFKTDKEIDIMEKFEFLAVYEGFMGKHINTFSNYGRVHANSLTERNLDKSFLTNSWRSRMYSLLNIKISNFEFKNRNFKIISRYNKKLSFYFKVSYYFYKLFYPHLKKKKSLFSLYFYFGILFNLTHKILNFFYSLFKLKFFSEKKL
jgi:glycosyltransferase involved in cell wall biosynthesis